MKTRHPRWLIFALALATVSAWGSDFSFTRTATNDVPGEALVTLSITYEGTGVCQAVEERLPGTLSISGQPSAGGACIDDLNAVRWGPFMGLSATSLTYRVKGLADTYAIEGSVWMDGLAVFALTNTSVCITVSDSGPATSPPERVALPVLTPGSAQTLPTEVTIACATVGAEIRYTLDGSLPTAASALYGDPLVITATTSLRACGFKDGMTPSPAAYGLYAAPPAQPDGTISFTRIATNDVPGEALITLSITFEGTGICHAVEERLPDTLSICGLPSAGGTGLEDLNMVRWGPFMGLSTTSLTYRVTGEAGTYMIEGGVWMDGLAAFALTGTSVRVTAQERVALPVLTPGSAPTVPVEVAIACGTVGAEIRYTLDGRLPTADSALYDGPLAITVPTSLQARGFKAGMMPSPVAYGRYGPPPPQNGFTRTATNDVPGEALVTLSITFEDSGICQAVEERLPSTLSMSDPPSSGGAYIEDLNAVRWGPFMGLSATSLTYRVKGLAGTYSIEGTAWLDGLAVFALTNTSVCITVSGSGPATSPPQRVALPVLTPGSAQALPTEVTIACATAGAEIRYTLDGSLPTAASALYGAPLAITAPTSLRACGFKAGMTPSPAAHGLYAAPQAEEGTVSFTRIATNDVPGEALVTLSITYEGTGICHAIEERLPGTLLICGLPAAAGVYIEDLHALRWGPFMGLSTTSLTYRVKGLAGTYAIDGKLWIDGFAPFALTNTSVRITVSDSGPATSPPQRVALPTLTPGSAHTLPVEVTIACATVGAEIRYTLDGSLPTEASALYDDSLVMDASTPLRARGFKVGMMPSPTAYGLYALPLGQAKNLLTLTRGIQGSGECLPTMTVTATVAIVESLSYSVTEILPLGVLPYVIGQNGFWCPTNRTIKWGPFDDGQSRILTYQLDGFDGTYILEGTGSANGLPAETTGDNSVTVVSVETAMHSDSDHDGMSDFIEWMTGYDPFDAESVFVVASPEPGTNSTMLTRWRSVDGVLYTLEKSTNLLEGFYILESAIEATAPTNTYEDAISPSRGSGFYRVRIEGVWE